MARYLILFVVIGLLTTPAIPLQAQTPLFAIAPNSPITVGHGSGQVVLADFNGDGDPDMLTRHPQERLVTVQLGDGTGHFIKAATSPLGFDYPPADMAVGDLNNDGLLDLGVRTNDRDQVDIFLGDGNANFALTAASPFAAGTQIYTFTKPSLHLIDLNEDGNLDFIMTNRRWNHFMTLLGDGHGAFAAGPSTRLGYAQEFYATAFGDVNGDGHLDVISANSGAGGERGRLVIKAGDGTGAFTRSPSRLFLIAAQPRDVTVADVDGDQHLDIVINHDGINQSGAFLSVWLNNGKGDFAPAPTSPFALSTPAFAVMVTDVNQDGKSDLLAATVNSRISPFESWVTILLGNDNGFSAAPGSPFPSGVGAYNLTVGDVNHDGKLDIATSSIESNGLTLLLGR